MSDVGCLYSAAVAISLFLRGFVTVRLRAAPVHNMGKKRPKAFLEIPSLSFVIQHGEEKVKFLAADLAFCQLSD